MSKEIETEKKRTDIEKLKARVYDLLVVKEQAQAEINKINQLLQEKLQKGATNG